MRAQSLIDQIIADRTLITHALDRRVAALEHELLQFCSCARYDNSLVIDHSSRCAYRIAMERVEHSL